MNDTSLVAALGWLVVASAVCVNSVQNEFVNRGKASIPLTAPPPTAAPVSISANRPEQPHTPGFYPAPVDEPYVPVGPIQDWQRYATHY